MVKLSKWYKAPFYESQCLSLLWKVSNGEQDIWKAKESDRFYLYRYRMLNSDVIAWECTYKWCKGKICTNSAATKDNAHWAAVNDGSKLCVRLLIEFINLMIFKNYVLLKILCPLPGWERGWGATDLQSGEILV